MTPEQLRRAEEWSETISRFTSISEMEGLFLTLVAEVKRLHVRADVADVAERALKNAANEALCVRSWPCASEESWINGYLKQAAAELAKEKDNV